MPNEPYQAIKPSLLKAELDAIYTRLQTGDRLNINDCIFLAKYLKKIPIILSHAGPRRSIQLKMLEQLLYEKRGGYRTDPHSFLILDNPTVPEREIRFRTEKMLSEFKKITGKVGRNVGTIISESLPLNTPKEIVNAISFLKVFTDAGGTAYIVPKDQPIEV